MNGNPLNIIYLLPKSSMNIIRRIDPIRDAHTNGRLKIMPTFSTSNPSIVSPESIKISGPYCEAALMPIAYWKKRSMLPMKTIFLYFVHN